MEFENIYSWIEFIQHAPYEQIEKILNDDLCLDEYFEPNNTSSIEKNDFLQIKEKLRNTGLEKLFWEKTLRILNVERIPQEIIEYLIDNEIAVLELGHMPLSNENLWKLVNLADEAVYTLGKRYYKNNEISGEEFCKFLHKFRDNYGLWGLLLNLNTENDQKRKSLIKELFLMTKFEDLKNRIIEDNKEKVLIKTKQVDMIERYFKENNYKFLRAIAQNPNTPESILNELILVSNVKYAAQIRNYAKSNLSKR